MKLRSSHVQRDQSALYALGALSAEDARHFGSHLDVCDACRTAVDGYRDVAGDFGLLAPPAAPRPDVRARLLARAAAERPLPAYQFVLAGEGVWREIRPGVFRKDLMVTAGAPRLYLIRMAAGATVTSHRHAAVEDCYVIAGDLRVAGRHLAHGDHHRAASGTVHDSIGSDGGCLLLIVDAAA